MKKLLFIAGESRSGKSEYIAKPIKKCGLGLVLHTDEISRHAAKHYLQDQSLGSKWQLWKHEFDRINNDFKLPLDQQCNLIYEGVLCGHPKFRQIMQSILPQFGFVPDSILTLSICVPWEQLQQNLKKRGRPKDQNIDFIKTRSSDYQQRLRNQTNVPYFVTTNDCFQAATNFLSSPTSIAR